jgi:hypothetical protein
MTNFIPSLVALTGKSLVGLTPIFAQATGGDATGQLKQGFSTALGILFMFGFFWGVIRNHHCRSRCHHGRALRHLQFERSGADALVLVPVAPS